MADLVLRPEHRQKALELLTQPLREMLVEYPLVVAGGFIRAIVAGEEPRDIDVFLNDQGLAAELAGRYSGQCGAPPPGRSSKAITVWPKDGIPVQFIYRWHFESPEDLIGSFDLTLSKAALWCDGEIWRSVVDPAFYPDVALRRITFVPPDRDDEDGAALLRILKFYRRGYRTNLSSLAAAVARLVDRDDEAPLTADLLAALREVEDCSDVDKKVYFRD